MEITPKNKKNTEDTQTLDMAAYSSMMENVPVNVMLANRDGIIVYVNQKSKDTLEKIEKYLPISASEIIGSSYDVFHKNPAFQKKMLGNVKNLPHQAIIEVGPEKLDLLVTAAYDANGDYMGPMLSWSIVTEKLKLEEEVEAKNLLFSALSKSQANIEFKLDGTVVSANDNFVKALGYNKAEDIVGKHHSIFCEKNYVASQAYKDFWNKLNRGEFEQGEFMRITKDGKEIWINASYNPVFDANGKVIKVVKFASDITKAKTEALKAELEAGRVTSMMENAPVNAMMADLNFTISYMNPKSRETLKTIEKLLPVSVDKIVGGSIDIFHKSPEKQRRMLADPRNLPHRAKINVGTEIMDLLVSPIYDKSRNYLGPMVTWELVTAKVQLAETLDQTSQQLASAAEELSAVANQMSANAAMTSEKSNTAAANSEEVSKGVQTVATNTEEMVASIKEISRSSSEAAGISKDAMKKAADTNTTITQLGEASQEIGNVIKVISSIAQQTNLLALNATIEAARAGDAGKGFAVVANEVKELAKQTAKATEDITNKIGAIQESSKGAVGAIAGISKVIEQINSISLTIAAAVEEQTATSNEVSRVMQESSGAVEGITQIVRSVAGAAQESSTGAAQTLEASKGLSNLASRLKDLVTKLQV
jgi:methyl-accepting chemotaxis protein